MTFEGSIFNKEIYIERKAEIDNANRQNNLLTESSNKQSNLQFDEKDKIKKIQSILGLPSNFIHHANQLPGKQLEGIQEIINDYLGANDIPAEKILNNIMKLLFINNSRVVEPSSNLTTQKVQEHAAEIRVLSINELLERPPPNPPKIERVKPNDLPYIRDDSYKPSQCPNSYAQKAAHSSWLRERYIPNVKMFLSKEDVNVFSTYHKLSHYGLPFGFARENRTLIAEVLNHPNYKSTSAYGTLSNKQCTRCAVVGCGGVLKGSGKGPEIDAHDHVFRVNRAITKGHLANDVGKRTSFYTFFPESDYTREIEDTETVDFFYAMFKSYDTAFSRNILNEIPPPLYKSSHRDPRQPPTPKVKVEQLRILHPDFLRYAFTHYLDAKSARPTTGALVVFLAMHLCDEVNIYGFGYDKRFTLHYYDTGFVKHTDAMMSAHDVDNERVLWRKLHEEGLISLFNRTSI
ncbi:alpha-N-acetylgalactosaminide alpha-2,6-sialyltransferase 1-like [Antedon mediterranea]|uniref:alpha-N-acetylgalactosaminide alpha-2,6-sialyltransferase 1-like n=1 Tax=Antedon mediterranea TaxID=105859 RepID=UPI003AF46698